jgi:hypothetical protein
LIGAQQREGATLEGRHEAEEAPDRASFARLGRHRIMACQGVGNGAADLGDIG